MSSFWDSVFSQDIVPSKDKVIKPVEKSDFWAMIGMETKPVKQSKVKATSKVVAQAEKVYETIEGLVVPADDCKHYWIIPSDTAWAIGVCKVCNGERWFSNRFIEESYKFNDTLVPSTTPTNTETERIDSDIKDIIAVYNKSIEEGA